MTTTFRTFTTTGMKNNTETFAQTIKAKRLEKGLSLREASALIGISHTYLSALENGRDPRSKKPVTPSAGVVFNVCKAYGLDFVELIGDSGIPDERTFYRYVAKKIFEMKKNNPRQYRQLLDVITGDKE